MTSLNISLPEALKGYVESQVASGDWSTPSEYVRELIRQDKERRMGNLRAGTSCRCEGEKNRGIDCRHPQEGAGHRAARESPTGVKSSRIVLSEVAVADILEQADWYEAQADQKLARRWEKSVTSALLRISVRPSAGGFAPSVRRNKGNRRSPVAGFPKHLIFYRVREKEILILRVVHGARDLESLFSGKAD